MCGFERQYQALLVGVIAVLFRKKYAPKGFASITFPHFWQLLPNCNPPRAPRHRPIRLYI